MMSTNMAWLDAAISKYVTGKLAQFRSELEEGTGQSISTLQVDVALLLSDLCRFFNLDEDQHNHVLGESGTQHVMQVLETRIAARTSPPLAQQVATPETMEVATGAYKTWGGE
jgi:hypothetical protein